MQKMKYSKEEKQKYLDEFLESGLGTKEWSQFHGIPRGTLEGWLSCYKKFGVPYKIHKQVPPSGPDIVDISPIGSDQMRSERPDDSVAEITYGRVKVCIKSGISPYILDRILSAFTGGASC